LGGGMSFIRGKLFFSPAPVPATVLSKEVCFYSSFKFFSPIIGQPHGQSQETAATRVTHPCKIKRDYIYYRRQIF
jgi:hypothetical protein